MPDVIIFVFIIFSLGGYLCALCEKDDKIELAFGYFCSLVFFSLISWLFISVTTPYTEISTQFSLFYTDHLNDKYTFGDGYECTSDDICQAAQQQNIPLVKHGVYQITRHKFSRMNCGIYRMISNINQIEITKIGSVSSVELLVKPQPEPPELPVEI